MILTRKLINQMRRYWHIDKTLEWMLLDQLGTEPYPHVYTEQNIAEQSRKMIMRYNEGEITGSVSFQTMKTSSDQEVLSDEIS